MAHKIHNSLFPKLLSDPLLESRVQRLKSLPSPSLRRRKHGIHGPLKPTQKVILKGQDNDYEDLPTSEDGMYDDLYDNNDKDSSIEILSKPKKPMNEDSDNNLSENVSSEFSEPENISNTSNNRNRNKIRNEDRAKRRSKSQGSTRPLQQQISHVPTPGGNNNTSSSNTRAIGRPKAKKKAKKKKTKRNILVPPAMNVPVNEMNQLSFEDRMESMLILTGADPRQKKKYKQIRYALKLFCTNYGI